MAEEAGTTQPTILRWMRKYNIPRNRNHATRGEKVEILCPICDTTFSRYKSKLKHADTPTCSTECASELLSQLNSGENHPQWKGGHHYYGANWYPMREKVRERDGNVCQVCERGKDKYGRVPAVHHIVPVIEFDDPTEAHTMDNMVQVCQWCHAEVEQMEPEKQREMFFW